MTEDSAGGPEPVASIGRVEATVHGRVQGVGFRWYAVRTASGLGLTGWVANRRDGTVRAVAEGPAGPLEAFVRALEDGPPGAVVDRVTVVRGKANGSFPRFEIRAGDHPGD